MAKNATNQPLEGAEYYIKPSRFNNPLEVAEYYTKP